MRLGLIWFSFRRDALSVVESVRSAKKLYPNESFIIANDARKPIPSLQLDILKSLGCEIINTTYNRGRNLRGRESILGQLSTMELITKGFDLTHLLKIDSDTVLLKSEWVTPHDLLGFSYSFYWGRSHICGLAYLISTKAVQRLLRHVKEDESRGRGGEDTMVTQYARELALDVVALEVEPSNLLAISYKWDKPEFDYSQCYAVTVGQGRKGRRCDDIELEAYAMAKLANS